MATTWSSIGSRSAKAVCTTGTESAPASTTAPSEGVILDSTGVVQVIAEADSGQTLSGAGSLLGYVWDETIGGWSRCPDLDVAVSVTTVRRQAWGGVQILGGRGRVAWLPSGVTVSSGGVTVYQLASGSRSEREGGPL